MSRYKGSTKNKKRSLSDPVGDEEDMIMEFDTPPPTYLEPTVDQIRDADEPMEEHFFLSMEGPSESSKAMVCYMAFYAFLRHDWIQREKRVVLGRKIHFRDFKHMFCSMRAQFPGLNGQGFSPEQLKEMRQYLSRQKTPPSFLPALICSSRHIEEWFGMPLEVVETVRDLAKLHDAPRVSAAVEDNQDPQASVWSALYPFLIELMQSPNVKMNLCPPARSEDASMTPTDIEELRACFAMAPSKCPVLPQLTTNKLCCVRYTKPHLQPRPSSPTSTNGREEYPSGVFSRADVELPSSDDARPEQQTRVLDFFRPDNSDRVGCAVYMPQIKSKSPSKGLPPHFFISDSYAEKLESFWICVNINNIAAGMAFDWYTQRVLSTKRQMSAEAAMEAFYKEKVGEVVEFWKKHMKVLYQFLADTRESLQKTWNSKLQ